MNADPYDRVLAYLRSNAYPVNINKIITDLADVAEPAQITGALKLMARRCLVTLTDGQAQAVTLDLNPVPAIAAKIAQIVEAEDPTPVSAERLAKELGVTLTIAKMQAGRAARRDMIACLEASPERRSGTSSVRTAPCRN